MKAGVKDFFSGAHKVTLIIFKSINCSVHGSLNIDEILWVHIMLLNYTVCVYSLCVLFPCSINYYSH